MNDHISKIINHRFRNHVIVGVASFVGGGIVGYILGRRETEETYVFEEKIDVDIQEAMDEVNEPRMKREPFIIEKEAYLTKGIDFVEEHLGHEVEVSEEPEVVTQNVFAGTDDDWDYEEELAKRSPDIPYVIHKDEFYAEETEFTQTTLTYYEGDNIMVDEDDTPIYNHETIVGTMQFGHGSGDPKVFYVRNEKNRAEYEIIHDPGLYSVEILGLEIEQNDRAKDLKHSAVPKFRDD